MGKNKKLSPEEMEVHTKELEQQLAIEKTQSESFGKMIEIAERELKIDIRKKIWCQTVLEMRQEHTSYRTDALCRLFGKSRQAYYEHSHYVADKAVEEDVALSLVRKARKGFSRMF
ncbi:MAG: hypothetical protein LBG15_08470 [Dysgonamonadaceae bacterium]|jgi:hypothetical protein|nr:hypothetical protein [Dysgonamonadaceae bacterium]